MLILGDKIKYHSKPGKTFYGPF